MKGVNLKTIEQALQYAVLYAKSEQEEAEFAQTLLQVVTAINNPIIETNYIDKVKEFMTLFGQPVVDKPTIMPENRNKLRISLILEELEEYAEASALSDYFIDLCDGKVSNYIQPPNIINTQEVNLNEQFDALLDLQYVLSGAVLENGFGNIFDEGFNEVHRSNMSKACSSEEEALNTCEHHQVEATYNTNSLPIIVYRKSDMKVLKSINYSPANLEPIINK